MNAYDVRLTELTMQLYPYITNLKGRGVGAYALLRGVDLPTPWFLNLRNAQTIEPTATWDAVSSPSAKNRYTFLQVQVLPSVTLVPARQNLKERIDLPFIIAFRTSESRLLDLGLISFSKDYVIMMSLYWRLTTSVVQSSIVFCFCIRVTFLHSLFSSCISLLKLQCS